MQTTQSLTYDIRYSQTREDVDKVVASSTTSIKAYEVNSYTLTRMLEGLSSIYAKDTNRSNLYYALYTLAMALDVSYDEMLAVANDLYIQNLIEDEVITRGRTDKDALLYSNVFEVVTISDNAGQLTFDINGTPTVLLEGTHYNLSSYQEVTSETVQKVFSTSEIGTLYTPITHVERVVRVNSAGTILERYTINSFTNTKIELSSNRDLATTFVEAEELTFGNYTKVYTTYSPIVGTPVVYNEEITDGEGTVVMYPHAYRIVKIEGNELTISFNGCEMVSGEQIRDLRDLQLRNIPLYIDYYYMTDILQIDYEWGRDAIDWTPSGTSVVSEGDTYYVTYRQGVRSFRAYENFGRLLSFNKVGKEILRTLTREEYRNAIEGAMSAFLMGPSVAAIKSLVAAFTKVDPEVRENVYDRHYVGIDYLVLKGVQSVGPISYTDAKFDQGVVIKRSTGATQPQLYFPAASNISVTEGTIQFWVYPMYDAQDSVTRTYFECLNDDDSGFTISKKAVGGTQCLSVDVYDEDGNALAAVYTDIESWYSFEPHLVTVTWQTNDTVADFINLYIDNQLADSVSGTGLDIGILPEYVYLGNTSDGDSPCDSILDEFRIQTQIRTLTMIQRDYQKTTPFYVEPQVVKSDNEPALTTILLHFDNDLERAVFKYKEEPIAHQYVTGKFEDAILLSTLALNLEHTTPLIVGNNSYTVDFWVSPYWNAEDETNTLYLFDSCLLDSEGVATSLTQNRVSLFKSGSTLTYRIYNSVGNTYTITYTIDWELGEWYHVAIGWTDSMMYLFVNGRLVERILYHEPSTISLTDYRFGQSYAGGLIAQVKIDDLRFSSTLRSSAELSTRLGSSAEALLLDSNTIRLYPLDFSTAHAVKIEPYSDTECRLRYLILRDKDYRAHQIEVDVLDPYDYLTTSAQSLITVLLEMLAPSGASISVEYF